MGVVEIPQDADAAATQRGVIHLVTAAILFSGLSVLAKLVGARVPLPQVILVRSLVTVAFARGTLARGDIPVWGTRRAMLALRGLFGFVALVCYFYALMHLPIADAIVIHYIHPVFTLLLATVVLGEALDRRETAFIVGCFVGVVLVTQPESLFGAGADSADPFALAIAVLGAVISAGVYVMIRELRSTEHPVRVVFYNALVAAILSAPWAATTWVTPDALEWTILLAIGVCTFLHQQSMTVGLHLVRAGRATALGYVQVLLAMLAGIWWFQEEVDLVAWCGAAILAVSAGWLATDRRRIPSRA
ncbi:Permease of the drug/metabolite transporter (DMT) superfamily [Nannocystis exedens]|uniref:Permease of the drug/metabolite transporter (DMT) superfamily n=1 Tax=Nannocystis exedens TaxID=54 RepID=A0A1I2ASJ9_9BACT|nr:DMT family transporter [Nannocystis exedens]PCC74252.1 EamA-like transporter family protein [Nannocystis exedens]SFE46985.1 Permease of the drug/metabolite transporter (DMT) superfamily [Nannocystis exedens]